MRELRVEDALMYLDQVKMEFGDRPQIYNEFLDIMKTFKSQQIDTPGVIKRVSSLFDGNRRLVLGFNTFLPEGYKIEIPIDNHGRPMAAVFRTPGQAGFTLINSEQGSNMENVPSVSQGGGPPGMPQQQQPPQPNPQQQQQQQQQQSQMPQQQQPPQPQPPQGAKQQIPHRGGMHGMPMQNQGQPMGGMDKGFSGAGPQRNMGQIHMVRNHGPPGNQMMQQQQPPQPQRNVPLHQGHMAQQQQQQPDQYRDAQQQQQFMQQQQHVDQQQQHVDQQQPQQPVEFDHAINYVTTIKRRFANEPDTYKKFLEILHTYQKEQRGIKEVLDEVSILFADHPDLLKDFTYFLPDAVQEQAKVQLDAAVRQAEQRKNALDAKKAVMNQAQAMQQAMPSAVGSEFSTRDTVLPPPIPFGAKAGRTEEREREICRSAIYGYVSFDPVRPPRKHELTPCKAAQKVGRPRTIPDSVVQPTTAEEAFLERAKAHLTRKELGPDKPPGSRRHTPHTEFLKCLHLFGAGILTKDELLSLLRGLFHQGHAPKSGANAGGGASHPRVAAAADQLLRNFEHLLVSRGPFAQQEQRIKDASPYGSVTIRELDESGCDEVSPSYRFLPKDYPASELHTHAGQSEEDASVLNNLVVSVGNERTSPSLKQRLLYSPEDYDGMRIRKNRYEEAMAMVEDERFETDMAIERNSNALTTVEPLAQEVTMLREKEEKDGQPIGRLHYKLRHRSLKINHVGAIARLYGDKGDEVLHHLMRNPVSVLPIVFNRLREKDIEWRKKRKELTAHWRNVCENNYEGSLDTLCWFYRREIEKSLSHEEIIQSCKRVKKIRMKKLQLAPSPVAPSFRLGHNDEKMLLFQQHSSFKASKNMPHHEAYELLSQQLMTGIAKTNADREKVSRIWSEFIVPWFNLPTHWFLGELRDKARSDKSSHIVKYADGQKVRTTFGDGTIYTMYDGGGNGVRYEVLLPFGVGFIRPSSILHHLPSCGNLKFARSNGFMQYIESDDRSDDGEKTLEESCHLLFGTEKIFIFMRLYCALVSLLQSGKDHLEKVFSSSDNQNGDGSTPMEIDSDETRQMYDSKQKTPLFLSLISNLKEYINEDIEFKSYEMSCRTMCKEHVHELAALPRLVEKCADALVKVAREDVLLSLYDYSQIKDMGPARKRKESLNIVNDGLYRIQHEPKEELLHCCYIARDRELESRYSKMPVNATNKLEENGAESSAHVNVERELDLQDTQPNKRMKLQ